MDGQCEKFHPTPQTTPVTRHTTRSTTNLQVTELTTDFATPLDPLGPLTGYRPPTTRYTLNREEPPSMFGRSGPFQHWPDDLHRSLEGIL